MSQTKVTDAMRNVTTVDGTKISGAVPSGALTNVDLSKLEYNQAILAFKVASANQLAKFSMVDQVIDEYQDSTGIDAGASTNELASGATTAKYYEGGSTVTPTVTGGDTNNVDPSDSNFWIHHFTSNGNFITDAAMTVDWLVVAGGGGGGAPDYAGGGGAGGLRTSFGSTSGGGGSAEADASMSAATYAVVVGAGGASVASYTNSATAQGADSSLIGTGVSITSVGGGRANYNVQGNSGGSGGGDGREGGVRSRTVAAGTANQGMAGGVSDPSDGGAGGGGASAVGEDAPTDNSRAGNGGAGLSVSITGAAVTYAGGGGGSAHGGANGSGGAGGGGAGTNTGTGHGTNGLGGGGGGTKTGGNTSSTGGSGVVIIRRPVTATTTGANLTLQSVATTAESAPTTADLVVLIEDGAGTATINTDIKAKVSRDGSAFSGYVTFVDEGDWGTNKRILVARNIDISGIATGTAMKYKIETLNQSAGSKETRIHATSLAWA